MNWETILSLGDSITIGARSYIGYPEFCGNHLNNLTNKNWNIINHAVSGFTTIDLARLVDKDFAMLSIAKPDVATLLIGTNDLKKGTSISNFKIAYELLLLKIKLITNHNNIILIKIPLLQEGVMLPYKIKMNDKVKYYNEVIQEISKREGLLLHDFSSKPEFFFDGVHLNETGSENWGLQLAQIIHKMRSL